MGGCIDWAAMPILIDVYGVEDVELFIAKLDAIRAHKQLVQESLHGK